MNHVSYRSVLLAAVAFAALDLLWLAGGNATWIAENQRAVVKTGSLILAALLLTVMAALTARQAAAKWLRPTMLTGGLSVGLSAVAILLVSAAWYPAQFFHDGVRLPQLFALLVGAPLAAALLSGGIGATVRSLAHPETGRYGAR